MLNKLKKAETDKVVLTKHEIYDIIRSYLQEQIDLSVRNMVNEDKFNLPAWSEYQATQIGLIKSYTKLLDFVPNLDKR